MNIIRRSILAAALIAGIVPALAQVPPAVPALPDTERRTTYTLTAQTCACAVGFALYGDSTDYQNWVEVWLNGVRVNFNDSTLGWTITSPTGSLGSIPRPVTDAVLTFTNAQTGTVQIVGARRPRRVSQFTENRGVAARDLNQVITDIVAQNRETWDKINDVTGRAMVAPPGETLSTIPVKSSRAGLGACYDSNGNPTVCASVPSTTFSAGTGIQFTGSSPTTVAVKPSDMASVWNSVCSSSIGQAWVQLSGGWGCTSLGYANPVWWGADPTGVADSTSAFTSAVAANRAVRVPCGTFKTSSVITLATDGQNIIGGGRNCTKINMSASASAFAFTASHTGFEIAGMTITQTTSGGVGIDAGVITSRAYLHNLDIFGFLDNIVLSNTDFSTAEDITLWQASSINLLITNQAGGSIGAQWQLRNVLAQQSAGQGFLLSCNGTGSMSVGNMEGLATFGNSSYGFEAAGSASCPINGLRVSNSFFGADGNSEVFLFTFATFPHAFTGVTVENAGTGLTGPSLSTAASNIGDGFQISGNEPAVVVDNPVINANSKNGINNQGSKVTVIGGSITNNGQSGAGNAGIAAAGRLIAQGVTIGNTNGTPQTNGIALAAGSDNSIVTGNDLRGNATNAISNTSGSTTTTIKDNKGFNPVGLTAGTSTGTSASSIAAGPSAETHYITQSATFNAAVKSGATTLCTVATATVPCVIDLGPNESYSVTWTTTQPTYSKFVH